MEYQRAVNSPPEKTHLATNIVSVDPASESLLYPSPGDHKFDTSYFSESQENRPKPTFRQRLLALRGWRLSIFLSFITTLAITILNIAVLAWVYGTLEIKDGSAIVFTGNKTQMKKISLWSHLLINILSSLLLAASNNAMQCLVAPTRKETEQAHIAGKWMQLGIPGMHNLSKIEGKRVLLWAIFLCSSLPIHLLYNSVMYETLGSNDYIIAYVGPDFMTGGPWYPDSWLSERNAQMAPLGKYQQTPNDLVRLEKEECIRAYGTSYVQEWSDVLVVLDRPGVTDTVYDISYNVQHWYSTPFPRWLCGMQDYTKFCSLQTALERASSWQYDVYPNSTTVPLLYHELVDVQYCLAQPATAKNYVEIGPTILIGVIVCNIVKLIAFVITLIYVFGDHDPLITTGDAVDSFLKTPDASSVGNSVLSARDVKSGRWASKKASTVWQPKRHFWFSAASVKRWISLGFLVTVFWTLGIVMLLYGIHNIDSGDFTKGIAQVPWENLSQLGFGEPNPASTIVESSVGITHVKFSNITQNIIVSNLPQLLLSIAYFLYNGTWTSMLTMHEWATYGLSSKSGGKAKGLRVSNPRGAQRSTLYLQLPYLYSVSLLVAAALLHWFLSRSLFITRINSAGLSRYHFDEDPDQILDALGWSPIPLICTLVLAFVMMLVLWINGFRRYGSSMPLAATNSLSVAAACHRRRNDPDDIGQKELVFGDVGSIMDDGERSTSHATFVSDINLVTALVAERSYT